ncbi:SMP-30/gluconolactonase/LRE family protein [Ottowia thiooxydans]|uniref:SMP-30/gluconolactonase/LRE family protein n=1 Tax=Ottowia thiooxydans TaxID=219182 RepID=UPI00041718FA|nr:SMP-30/gluconolactonase/LRE family protein [Ottowia thiooxydans]
MNIQRLGELKTALGECPTWFEEKLWLMDCRAGLVFALNPDTGAVTARHEAPAPLGSFAFNQDGAIVLAMKEHIAAMSLPAGELRMLAHIGCSHPNLRLNDGIALPDGSFITGTMHLAREPGEEPLGGLYRLDTQLKLHKVDTGLGITNGPCISPTNGRLYVADSAAHCIYSYLMAADGTLSDKKVFVNTEPYHSSPDGCCFDNEGGLWTALVRAGSLIRFDQSGVPTHQIELPVKHPTALCFGGPDMSDIFITSISDSGRLSASGPMDGGVLKLTGLGFQGMARPLCRFPL